MQLSFPAEEEHKENREGGGLSLGLCSVTGITPVIPFGIIPMVSVHPKAQLVDINQFTSHLLVCCTVCLLHSRCWL